MEKTESVSLMGKQIPFVFKSYGHSESGQISHAGIGGEGLFEQDNKADIKNLCRGENLSGSRPYPVKIPAFWNRLQYY